MRHLILPVVFACGAAGIAAAGPGIVGNGGDAVSCRDEAGSQFKGYYSLDFLLTYDTRSQNRDVEAAFSWEESRDRLFALLDARDPDLAYSFRSFVADMDNTFDYSRRRIWHEAGFGLVDVKDERIIRKLPANCYDLRGDGSIQITQAVVQEQRPDLFVFEFDPQVYDEFKRLAPLQFSFLMVHEWLWEWTDDVHVVRDANRFLHSTTAAALNAEAFRQAFTSMGLSLRPTQFKAVCDRPEAIRIALEAMTGKACGTITEGEINWVPDYNHAGNKMAVDGKALPGLGIADLGGLASVTDLRITNAGLEHVNANELVNFTRLAILDLSHNRLSNLGPFLSTPTQWLVAVNLADNAIETLPHAFLAGKNWYCSGSVPEPAYSLDLSGNKLRSAVLDAPEPAHFQYIDLSRNKLTKLDPSLCKLACPINHAGRETAIMTVTGNPLPAAEIAAFRQSCPNMQVIP